MKKLTIAAIAVLTGCILFGDVVDDVIKGGEPALRECCAKLVDASARADADDTETRMVLHGICVQARTRKVESMVEKVLLDALKNAKEPEVKAFLLEQLYYVAGSASVPALSEMLLQPEYCDAVCRILVYLPDAPRVSGPVLASALSRMEGVSRSSIIQALGELGVSESAEAIVRDLDSKESKVRWAAIQALGRLDHPTAKKAVTGLAGKRGIASKYEQLVIDGVVGEAMKNWVLWGDKQGAMALGRTWKQGRDKDIAVQCSFLEMCERIGDAESDQLLVAGLAHQELRVRLSASRLLAKNFNAARQKLVCDALMGGKITLESIELLGKCGNSEAVPALDRIIASDDAANRSAAIGSVVRILGKDSLSRLAGWLSDQREGVSDAATNAVVALPGSLGPELVNLADKSDVSLRPAFLSILERRVESGILGSVQAFAKDGDSATLQALCKLHGALGDVEALPFMLEQVKLSVEDKDWSTAAERGLLALCRRIGDFKLYWPQVKASYEAGVDAVKSSLLKVAGVAGTKEAFALLEEAWRSGASSVKESSLRVMADWRDSSALPKLREIAQTEPVGVNQILAFRGCIRLIPMQSKPSAEKVDDLLGMMDLAKRVEERRLVIGALGSSQDGKALATLTAALDDDGLKSDAALAVVVLSEHLRSLECVPALRKAMPLLSGAQLDRAKAAMAVIADNAGKIMRWQVSPIYRQEGKSYHDLQNTPFAPEMPAEAASVIWKEYGCDKSGKLDLHKMPDAGSNVTVYARCVLRVPQATKAMILVGSDDAVKVWLNGTQLEDVNVPRAYKAYDDKLPVELKQGDNELLCKIGQGGGQWVIGAKVVAQDESPLENLVITLK